MDTPTTETAGIGHNKPNAYESAKDRVDQLVSAADVWNNLTELKDEDQATKAKDFIERVKAETKDLDAERLKLTKPLRDQTTEINGQFNALVNALDKIRSVIVPLQTKYLKEEKRKADEELKRQEDEAKRKQEEAEDAARKAAESETGVSDALAAEEAQKDADDSAKAAKKLSQTTVGTSGNFGARKTSLRTNYFAKVTDHKAAAEHFIDHPKMVTLVQELANAWARSPEDRKTPIPGVELDSEEKAS